jgi:hypothetical protein
MREYSKMVAQSPRKYNANDVAKIVTEMFRQAAPLNDENTEMLENLAEQLLTSQGKQK